MELYQIIFLTGLYLVIGYVFAIGTLHHFLDGARFAGGGRVTAFDAVFINLTWPILLTIMVIFYALERLFTWHPLIRLYGLEDKRRR